MKKRVSKKKGISPLIATVLIIGFTVALGAVVMIWGGGFVGTMQESSEQSMEASQMCAAAMVNVDNIQPESANRVSFMMENIGQTKIDSVIVRITGTDGVDSVVVKKNLDIAAKSLFSAKFDPEKVGLLTKIDIIPNLNINAKQTPCTPGITFSADTPPQALVDQWQSANDNDIIDTGIEDCDNTANPMFPSKPGGGIWDCEYLGFGGGNLICTDSGTIDVSECTDGTTCGNNQLDPEVGDPTEGCDYIDGIPTYIAGITDCVSLDAAVGGEYGYTKGSLSCDADCMIDTSQCTAEAVAGPVCGNNKIEGTEKCDGTDLGGIACGVGSYPKPPYRGVITCKEDCTIDASKCTVCGNNVREGNEQCDGTDLIQPCQTVGFMGGGQLECTRICTFDTRLCYSDLPIKCNNGIIDADVHKEECDKTNLHGETCQTLGWEGGALGCWSTCTFNIFNCF